ncbi:hypothetical protein Taro_030228 [Colocasia esculenta]|uniref:Uncharacterized protein n=1 Tax=Colocasia esculenta TaxID=4460 RepID=A0A843VLX6_COLES|nr:hypothetical protein [Colocasia esculenta]
MGRLRDIVGGDGAVRAPQHHVRRELTTDDGNFRREMDPQHAQHASPRSNTTNPDLKPSSSPSPSSTSKDNPSAEPAS